ncbi:phosphoribosylglycinamide formyltransferase [Reichenbachiella sp. MALMAid0571]|uniref:phosphoribosylglycinamide formyltransferase n=1 Tax=Reichenbachiella sp. MALMAid0571 TaxID=3143939 RepID=UPI0032DE3B22
MKKKLAIFASGSGTNAEKFFEYFQDSDEVEISLLLSNKADAYALQRAKNHNVASHVFSKEDMYKSENLLELLKQNEIDFIVLAGFLWLIPKNLIAAYPDKIINIHPALLPRYGGKGMYGMRVHEKVRENGDFESGITIHLVNEKYDEGEYLIQKSTPIDKSDSPEDIANKIHQLEYRYFAQVVDDYIRRFDN